MKTIKQNIEKRAAGFTLVELLVVVVIIGILAALGLPQLFTAVERSKVAETTDVLGNVLGSQERYQARAGSYDTTDFSYLDAKLNDVNANPITGTTGSLQHFSIELAPSSNNDGSYELKFTRNADTATSRFGAYTITYSPCGSTIAGDTCAPTFSGGNCGTNPNICQNELSNAAPTPASQKPPINQKPGDTGVNTL